MKKLLMVCALLWMPVLGYGYESYTHEDASYTYYYRVENGEACVTGIKLEGGNHVGGPDAIYKRMVRYNNNGSILAEYPVTIIGDGNGTWNIFQRSYYHGCGVSLPEGIREIRAGAFRGMNHSPALNPGAPDNGWEYVYLPTTLKTVGENAFEGDTQIKHLRIDDLAAWCDIDFANAVANPLTYAKSLRLANKNLFINGNYSYEVVKDLVVPNGVKEIKPYSFYNCAPLASVEFPWSCRAIGDLAFYGCTNLSALAIHDNIANVGAGAFQDCTKLASVSLGNGLTSVSANLFRGCTALKSFKLGKNIKAIEAGAFARTCVTNGIPDGVTSIGDEAFRDCSGLTGLVLPSSVTNIGANAFYGCPYLSYIVIPAGIQSIGENVTYYCSDLFNIIGPRRLEPYFRAMNPAAFYTYNDVLVSLDANGGEVESESALVDLYSTVGELPVPVRWNHSFLGWFTAAVGGTQVSADTVLTGDMTLYAHWEEVEYTWHTKEIDGGVAITGVEPARGNVAVPEEIGGRPVKAIYDNAFSGQNELTGVKLPNSVTRIGWGAFYGCSGLTSVTIPDSVTSIGGHAFYGCDSSLYDTTTISGVKLVDGWAIGSTVILPSHLDLTGIRGIGSEAFYGCKWLTSVTIPDGVTSIGDHAFGYCDLTSVTIPDSVTSIGYEAFYGCDSSLYDTTTISGVKLVDGWAIGTTGTLPSHLDLTGIRGIGPSSFSGCSGLTSVTIGNGVTSIGDLAFYNCSGLMSVTIPNSVTRIGNEAFACCDRLTSVTIPNGVTSIGNYAFGGCRGLTSVTIPDSVTRIGNEAFYHCDQLENVTIGSGVTHIGERAFFRLNMLTCISISSGVTYIGDGAFAFCPNLQSIVVDSGNTAYKTVDGLLLSKDGKTLVAVPGDLASVTIPSGVTRIGNDTFSACFRLTSVAMPDSVMDIGERAFVSCNSLRSLTIPAGVTNIGICAFQECSSLTTVTIPSSVTSIGEGAFGHCFGLRSFEVDSGNTAYKAVNGLLLSKDGTMLVAVPGGLESVTIPSGVTSIWAGTFHQCYPLMSVSIPSSVTSIGDLAFWNCHNLSCVIFNGNAPDVGNWAFAYMNSSCVVYANTSSTGWVLDGNGLWQGLPIEFVDNTAALPDYALTIVDGVLTGVKLYGAATEIAIPTNVTSIGDYAFEGCNGLTSVTIPNSVTNIGEAAFASCSGLTSVTIGNGVTSIGERAFVGCDGLTSVTIPDSVTNIGGAAFAECSSLASVMIPNSVTSIGERAFVGCDGLTSVTIPNGVTSIGDYAFEGCNGLTSVTIPNSVTSIGMGAFFYCSSLTSVTIPDSVTNIGGAAFAECSSLASVMIPNSVTSIGNSVFYGCIGLTSVTIPDGVTSIGSYAFNSCSGLTSVTIPDSVTSIGDRAFYDCSGLTSVTIPQYVCNSVLEWFFDVSVVTNVIISDGVTSIRDWAFRGCSGLTSVTIPNSVTSIGEGAFCYCQNANFTSVTIPASVKQIGREAFGICSHLSTVTFAGTEGDIDIADTAFIATPYDAAKPFSLIVTNGMLIGFHGTAPENLVISNYLDGQSITTIGGGAISDQGGDISALRSVVIPEGVTRIEGNAFHSCSGLTSVTIPDSVTTIEGGAFWCCSGLTNVVIGSGVTSIETYTFLFCISLREIWIPAGVKSIEGDAFAYCENLTVHAPETLNGTFSVPEGCTIEYYEIPHYTVTFDANRGTVDGSATAEWTIYEGWTFDSAWGGLPVPTRSGYAFTGWFTSAAGGDRATAADSVTGDMTLYAHWRELNPPSNDNFANATLISGASGSINGTTVDATRETDDLIPDYYDYEYESTVWYRWTAPANGTYAFSVADADAASDWSCAVGVSSGYDAGSAEWLDGAVEWGSVAIDAVAGKDYWIEVGSGSDEEFDFVLTWTQPPANDEYENAQTLPGTDFGSAQGTLQGATITDNDCIWRYGYAQRTVWYKWVAPFTGTAMFAATAANGRSDLLYLVATRGYDEENGWDDCGYDWGNRVVFAVREGETYYVSLCTWNYVVSGFTLSWQQLQPPENDDFASATVINGAYGRAASTNVGAGVEEGEPLPLEEEGNWTFATTASVWWKWTAPTNGYFTFKTLGSNFDTVLGVYTGSIVDTLVRITANDEGFDDGTSVVTFDAVAGTTYYIAVGGYFTHTGIITLSWLPEGEPIPVIDLDASAVVVTNAIEAAGFVDAGVEDAIGGSAAAYNAFKAWAGSVKNVAGNTSAGEAVVVANTNAAAAWLLGAERLFANAPEIKISVESVDEQAGGTAVGVAVTVKDGAEAVTCAAEKVKDMFEATGDLGDWDGAAKLTPTVTVESSSGATMRFTVRPGDGTASRAFLRIRK